jgi:MFS transporter, ACS family, hexuronate transporter
MAALPSAQPADGAAPESRASRARTPRAGSVRWSICGLLFLAATINYVDRQVIALLKPTLQGELGWSEIDYGDIVFAFQFAYAIGYVFAGRLVDRLGTRRGFSLALAVWSLAAMAHAWAVTFGGAAASVLRLAGVVYPATVAGFIAARFALGLGESGNFPAALKTVAEWFPRRERALATGLFNAGTNVGALVTPLFVPWIVFRYGWAWAFIITGALGFGWLALWWTVYDHPDRHPWLGAAERAHIRAGDDVAGDDVEPAAPVGWMRLIPHRQTWAYTIGKFLTDPIWWVYLFWIPDYFSRVHGLSLGELGPPLVTIYLAADAGSVGGGWLSSTLLRRGFSVNVARKTAMLICAIAVVPIVGAAHVQNMWIAVALISLAAAAHQGWSANLFTLPSDTFPRGAVGTVVGIGGAAGAVGGMLISKVTAYILEFTGSYLPVFVIAGSVYLVALLVIHLLSPTLEAAHVD